MKKFWTVIIVCSSEPLELWASKFECSSMLSPFLCHKSRWAPWTQTQTSNSPFVISRGRLPGLALMLVDVLMREESIFNCLLFCFQVSSSYALVLKPIINILGSSLLPLLLLDISEITSYPGEWGLFPQSQSVSTRAVTMVLSMCYFWHSLTGFSISSLV